MVVAKRSPPDGSYSVCCFAQVLTPPFHKTTKKQKLWIRGFRNIHGVLLRGAYPFFRSLIPRLSGSMLMALFLRRFMISGPENPHCAYLREWS